MIYTSLCRESKEEAREVPREAAGMRKLSGSPCLHSLRTACTPCSTGAPCTPSAEQLLCSITPHRTMCPPPPPLASQLHFPHWLHCSWILCPWETVLVAGLGPGIHYGSISSGRAGSPGSWGCPSGHVDRADAVKGVKMGKNLHDMTAGPEGCRGFRLQLVAHLLILGKLPHFSGTWFFPVYLKGRTRNNNYYYLLSIFHVPGALVKILHALV